MCVKACTNICEGQSLNGWRTYTNLRVARGPPKAAMWCLSKPHLGDRQVALPTDATYLPQIIVQPDVLWVLPEAVFPPLRGGTATGPTAAKSEGERKHTWVEKVGRESLYAELEDTKQTCRAGDRLPGTQGTWWRPACCLPEQGVTALVPPRGTSLCVGTQQCPCLTISWLLIEMMAV